MSFFEELKRRNVFRVGTAYVVLAWLLAQISDLAADTFDAPNWVMKMLVTLLALAFPLVLFFAWAYEMTPEGIKKEKDVDRSQSITPQTGRKLDFVIIGVLVVALSYFAYDKFASGGSEKGSEPFSPDESSVSTDGFGKRALTPFQTTTAKSIAVLPFVNMSDDASNEYFSDGISEEILNSLAKVKELKVAGRTSSFAFKGQNQDLRLIGETLGVENILEGSVRKFGDQVRITAQLIQVSDGFHLWSESYDRKLENVFAIQDEIANAILAELKATLLEGEAEAVTVARTNPEAYEAYLLAKQRMYERTTLSLQAAADLLDKAIAIDPAYAPAYAQRGITELLLSDTSYGQIPHDQSAAQARLYLDKALALDENLAEAWAGLGLYYNGPPPQPDAGIPVLEKALAINPNLIDASNWLAMTYWSVNRVTDSLALLDGIAERDPLYKPAIGNRAYVMAIVGRGAEAMSQLDALEPFMPGDPQIDGSRAWIEFNTGHTASALRRSEKIMQMQPDDRTYRVSVNQGLFETHQFDRVFDDHFSPYLIKAQFHLGRAEEATIAARERAANGDVGPLFALLNANQQSELLIGYLEERWPDLASFSKDVPPNGLSGYREMADVAYAYRSVGNQARFDEALASLGAESQKTLAQGVQSGDFLFVLAAWHVMAGDQDEALKYLAQAIDGGYITSTRISKEYPYFKDLEGSPEFEAIQTRMIEELNRERAELGLAPVQA